ncbi:MAG TPA: MFS transporter [bacterium]|nr:MFS transporter [bacterium]
MARRIKTLESPGSPAPWSWLGRQVLALGLVSLLTDMGTEMGMPLLPALVTGLGGGAVALGLIDGLADTVAALLQLFAGRRADRSGQRRPWVLFGYGFSGLMRPLFGLAGAPWQVVAVRSADRVGKGLRKPSRDSLLEAAATPETRGRVFGFHDAMDNAGQVLGPLTAVALLALFAGDPRKVLVLAIVPGALAFAAVLFLVREEGPKADKKAPVLSWIPPLEILPALIPIALFTLGNASDLFLLLKVQSAGAPLWGLALLWSAFAVVKVLGALLGGPLADRLGARAAISLGWAWYGIIYLAFARAGSVRAMVALFLAYGLFHGFSEGPQKALVGALAPKALKATCFGWLGLTTGLLALPAGLLFGGLWAWQGPACAFSAGAALALGGLALLWTPWVRSPGPEARA